MGRTLAEKIWDAHLVRSAAGEPDLLYIDLHLVHEVTSRWCSRATAIRCAVGRASPVALTSWASEVGPVSMALSTETALSRTPTPLELFMS